MSNVIIEYPAGATPLDLDEIAGLKFKHVKTRGELDHLEQANIEDGLLWLQKYKSTDVLSEQFIRTLHTRMFGQVWDWAGKFRWSEKNIGVDPLHIAVELKKLVADATYWIEHEVFANIEIALRFHHKLVSIHPFPNGNGRHSRIMTDVLLTRRLNDKAIDWSGGYDLSSMSTRREQYIEALRAADKGSFNLLRDFCKQTTPPI